MPSRTKKVAWWPGAPPQRPQAGAGLKGGKSCAGLVPEGKTEAAEVRACDHDRLAGKREAAACSVQQEAGRPQERCKRARCDE